MDKFLKNMKFVLLLMVGISFAPTQALADKHLTILTPYTARTTAMGMAGINLIDDPFAAFYNPANIASKSQHTKIQPFNLQGDMDLGAGESVSKRRQGSLFDLNSIYRYMKSNPDKWVGARYSIYPNITFRGLSFGFLYDNSFAAKYQAPAAHLGEPQAKLRQWGYRKVAPTVAWGMRFFGGLLRIGYSFQLEYVGKVDTSVVDPDSQSVGWTKGIKEGLGMNHTAGMTFTMPIQHLPSFSVVARNIGRTKYTAGTLSESVPMSVDAGVSHTTYFGRYLHIALEGDYRDFLNAHKINLARHLFGGAEIRLFNFLRLRGGYGQGYPTGGVGLVFPRGSLEASYYTEEMGDRLRDNKDKRFLLQFTWSLITNAKKGSK